ncbi:hypothetical protein ABFS83_14G073100 [Erythranthe nasuta]
MDDIHKIAKAYYARATEEEKEKIQNHFRLLDVNCDGKVSFAEYEGIGYKNKLVFISLDRNGDGSLDFDEVLALYFLYNKCEMPWCDACGGMLTGAYFSCLTCEKNYPNTYDLCCSCYGEGKYEHHHPTASFFDNRSMRRLLAKMMNDVQLSQPDEATRKQDDNMDEIRKIAKAYYARATDEEKEKAKNYFRSLDVNCKGKVSFDEYKTMVSQRYANDTMFNSFDRNGDRSLDFEEVLVLHFVHNIYVMRWCCACTGSLPGLHFSCLTCEKNEPNTFDLCCSCYDEGKFEHHHPTSDFLDNHSMRNLLAPKMNTPQLRSPNDENVDNTNTDELQFHNATNRWGEEASEASRVSRRILGWFNGGV